MLIKFILTFMVYTCQKMKQNVNLLQSLLLIIYQFTKKYKYNQQVCFGNCAYRIIDKGIMDFLNGDLFGDNENQNL